MQKLTHDHSPVGEREDAQEITEIDAMRHPRRHEVFRDVGGALRDKDEDDYVEVVEDALERDAAILLCTDGLTDMVPSTTIERLVRRHAGSSGSSRGALVSAANDAGGRDNVTVVYAEGPDFARAVRGRSPNGAPAAPPRLPDGGVDSELTERRVEAQPGRLVRFAGSCTAGPHGSRSERSPASLGALLLVWRTPDTEIGGARTIGVGSSASFDLLARWQQPPAPARAGDVLRLEPGMYAERVTLGDGVSLVGAGPGQRDFRSAVAPGRRLEQ